jgi:hypothetical protein
MIRSLLLLFLYSFAITSASQAQWIEDESRRQEMNVHGNGALIVNDGVLWFWNETKHFQYSTDYGSTWQDPSDNIGGANPHVTFMSASGNRVYAALNFGTGQGIPIYSTDMGVTWIEDTLGAPGSAQTGRPTVGKAYAWGGKWVFVTWGQPKGYSLKTFDGPYVFNTFLNEGINNPSSVVAKGDTLFLSGAKVYYTTDGGQTFVTPANNGYAGYGAQLSVDGSRLYMAAFEGWQKPAYIFYSDDNAENWTKGPEIPYPNLYFIRGNNMEIALNAEKVNTTPNVKYSNDGGATFVIDTLGLPTEYVPGVTGFAYTPDGMLWISPAHQKLFKRKFDEGTVTTPEVTEAPNMISPEQDAILPGDAKFVWSKVANATHYDLQVSGDQTFANLTYDKQDLTDTTIRIEFPEEGNYFWRVRGQNGDQSGPWSDAMLFRIQAMSVRDNVADALVISPNPAHAVATLHAAPSVHRTMRVVDVLGRTVHTTKVIENTSTSISLSDFEMGHYFILVQCSDGNVIQLPLLVQ